MARQRSPDSLKAEKMYIDSKGAMELIEIAKKLKTSPGTVRSWKNRYKWDELIGNATLQKKKATQPKKQRNEKRNTKIVKDTSKAEEKAVKKVSVENDDLTEKQKNFCLYFVKYWNATKAYQKAYDSTYNTAMVEGSSHLRKPKIKAEIDRLKQGIREGIQIDTMAIIQKYADIAFADVGDFVTFGRREVPVMGPFGPITGEDGETLMKEVNFVDLKPDEKVDGTIITEVKQGKEGVSIKLADKMKALEKLEKYYDLIPDNFKRKLDSEKLKLDQDKHQLIVDKEKGSDEELSKLDKLLQSIDGMAKE